MNKHTLLLHKKRLTLEMTWDETEYTQAKGNKTTRKQSRCFAPRHLSRYVVAFIVEKTLALALFKLLLPFNLVGGAADGMFDFR